MSNLTFRSSLEPAPTGLPVDVSPFVYVVSCGLAATLRASGYACRRLKTIQRAPADPTNTPAINHKHRNSTPQTPKVLRHKHPRYTPQAFLFCYRKRVHGTPQYIYIYIYISRIAWCQHLNEKPRGQHLNERPRRRVNKIQYGNENIFRKSFNK